MKAYVITLMGNKESEQLAENVEQSIQDTGTQLEIEIFPATTPETLGDHIRETFGKTVPWTWSSSPEEDHMDFNTNLFKKSYKAADQMRVRACAVSHARLWNKIHTENEVAVVLEHDATFVKKFDPSKYIHKKWGVLGLNDPRGNTRKAQRFHAAIDSSGKGVHDIPTIDFEGELPLPMGLAGNSAYIIKPHAAGRLIEKIEEIGLWPNDAIMCKQLFPSLLKVTNPYYTNTQTNVSSTTQ